jgi:UDP-N-acetylmuramate dehydrogenase
LIIVKGEDISFGYRQSFLRHGLSRALSRGSGQALQGLGILTGAKLKLRPDDPDRIKDEMRGFLERRRSTQPIQALTAGSVFKNYHGRHAAFLIQEAGCGGLRVGDAVVSDKHVNFIINKGEARAADIYRLLKMVQIRVKEKSGILLEPEIIMLGEFGE